MTWYTSAILTILFWGIADTFYKKGTSPTDKYSHFENCDYGWIGNGHPSAIWTFENGVAIQSCQYCQVSASIFYVHFVHDFGLCPTPLHFLEVSISSPVLAILRGRLQGFLSFIFLGKTMNSWQLIAVTMITVGLVAIAFEERKQALLLEKQQSRTVDKSTL